MSDKERDLILFLNKKTDLLYHSNDKLKNAINFDSSNSQILNSYVVGYDNAIKDFKFILLNLLKGEAVSYDEKESA